ncbi:MAG: CBM9 family sugar-binding protein [Cellulophaga sp.]
MKHLFLIVFSISLLSCSETIRKEDRQITEVQKTTILPTIDGKATDNCWNTTTWLNLDQNWLGNAYTNKDFNGRYKLLWDEKALYILVEIIDDVLYDQNDNPLELWWDDDCMEVFIDEDNSGGDHQYNTNAFAYHIALDGNVVDLDKNKNPILYNNHITSKRNTEGNRSIWEMSVKLYADTYIDEEENTSTPLSKNKKIGFALAYCDNDTSKERENFIGSVFIPGEDKNQGWINASIFGTLVLKE